MQSTRRLFLGAIAAAASFIPFARGAVANVASKPPVSGLKALIEAQRAQREAGPACHFFDTRLRGVNGLSCVKHPPIFGDGERDDCPGIKAVLEDRGKVVLPAGRLYRLDKPLDAQGEIEVSDVGVAWSSVSCSALGKPLAEGHSRFFYQDKVDVGSLAERHEIIVTDLPA